MDLCPRKYNVGENRGSRSMKAKIKQAGFKNIKAFCEHMGVSTDTAYHWPKRGVPRWVGLYLVERIRRMDLEKELAEIQGERDARS